MAGVRYTIEDAEFRRRVSALKKGVEDGTPLMKRWGEIVREAIDYNFEQGGRPGRWKKLSPVTVKLKALRGGSAPERILFFKGFLRGGISVKPESTRVVVGTSPNTRAYAAIQQFGGMAGRGRKVKIPARPYMVLTPGDKDELREESIKYFQEIAR